MFVYEKIYEKLDQLTGGLEEFLNEPSGRKALKAAGYMDLIIEDVSSKPGQKKISLTHYFAQNGDLMADPDMEVGIYPEMKMAEALTYQLDSLGIYQVVYPEEGKIDIRAKKELNQFLLLWLRNLKAQGFY